MTFLAVVGALALAAMAVSLAIILAVVLRYVLAERERKHREERMRSRMRSIVEEAKVRYPTVRGIFWRDTGTLICPRCESTVCQIGVGVGSPTMPAPAICRCGLTVVAT